MLPDVSLLLKYEKIHSTFYKSVDRQHAFLSEPVPGYCPL